MKIPNIEHLTSEDRRLVAEIENQLSNTIETIERAKSFKVGDYLIMKKGDLLNEQPETSLSVHTNSYGAPVKYKVVHIDKNGIAYVKCINKKGVPYGKLISCFVGDSDDDYAFSGHFVFELDPDFADSLLLEDEYDPASLHRNKKDIWKAVTEHNKQHKIVTKELYDVVTFFRTVNPGDTYWTSNTNSIFIKDKKEVVQSEYNRTCKKGLTTRISTRIRNSHTITLLTIVDNKGKEKEVPPDFFWSKALYRERPRTYRELNI